MIGRDFWYSKVVFSQIWQFFLSKDSRISGFSVNLFSWICLLFDLIFTFSYHRFYENGIGSFGKSYNILSRNQGWQGLYSSLFFFFIKIRAWTKSTLQASLYVLWTEIERETRMKNRWRLFCYWPRGNVQNLGFFRVPEILFSNFFCRFGILLPSIFKIVYYIKFQFFMF